VVVRPYLDGAPDRVRASHRSLYGTVTSDWAKAGPAFRLTVTVPVNTTATVCVPAPGPVTRPPGARDTGRHDGCAWYEVGSGSYTFRTGP
jgi:alpha-L-rhamnosidase